MDEALRNKTAFCYIVFLINDGKLTLEDLGNCVKKKIAEMDTGYRWLNTKSQEEAKLFGGTAGMQALLSLSQSPCLTKILADKATAIKDISRVANISQQEAEEFINYLLAI